MPFGTSIFCQPTTQGFSVGVPGRLARGGVPRAQRDEFPQLPLPNDLMTKKIRLCADTKESREPHPAAGAVSLSDPKTDQEAINRFVTRTPQSICAPSPPGHSLKKWPGGEEVPHQARGNACQTTFLPAFGISATSWAGERIGIV